MSICVIPAKGTSTRVPKKNIREFFGKPIIAYSIEAARESKCFDEIWVSTDSKEVVRTVEPLDVLIHWRGADLCEDSVGPLDVAREVVRKLKADEVAVIYATAPLVSHLDIIEARRVMWRKNCKYCVSVGTDPFLHDAAQFFWARTTALLNKVPEFDRHTVMYRIPPERDIDINTEEDWLMAEQKYKRWKQFSEAPDATD